MVHNTKVAMRPRGRPQLRPDEETLELIVTAAREEFHANGYAGASMAQVAERAGVSTKTMYRLVPTKTELFRNVVSSRISRFMFELDQAHLETLPLEEALEHMLVSYGNLTLADDMVATLRLVFAECGRFPEIGSAFYEMGLRRTTQTMESWLRRQCELGTIAIADPSMAVGMLRGMMIMEPQRAMMLGQRKPPGRAEIARRAQACARLFLDGCRARPPVGTA